MITKYHRHPLTRQQLSKLNEEPMFKVSQGTAMLIITLGVAIAVMTIKYFGEIGNW